METVLETKLIENLNFYLKNPYYSLYSLKVNRSPSFISEQIVLGVDQNHNSTVVQFLDKEFMLNKDFSLSSLLNSMPDQNESYLRENLARKIEKGTLYACNNGSVSTFNLGFKRDGTDVESICYFNLYRQPKEPFSEFIVCFTIDDAKQNLDLFQNELDYFFKINVEKYLSNQSDFKELEDLYLKNWYDYAIRYLNRPIELLNENICVFIEEAFSCGQFDLDPKLDIKTKSDFNFLFQTLNCNYLVANAPNAYFNNESNKSRKILKEEIKLSIQMSGSNTLSLSKKHFSKFSKELAQKLNDKCYHHQDPFLLKQIIENYKLTFAQELNNFNRLLRSAENNYYDIYKTFLYLKHSQMSQALISTIKNSLNNQEDNSNINLARMFQVLINFYSKNARICVE